MTGSTELLRRTWIVAHRGAREETPENTRAAFVRALEYPIDAIELDVQLSADDETVIYHDWTLRRLGLGPRRLADLKRAELARLDWGGWFDPRFAGEPLPLLEEILTELGPRTRWLIEIKANDADIASGRGAQLVDRLLGLLERIEHLPGDAVHILCFDSTLLAYAASKAPHRRYVLNLNAATTEKIISSPMAVAHLWAVDAPVAKLSQSLRRWSRERGLRLLTYTCNGPRQISKALRCEVDGVITDRPGHLTRLWGRTVHKEPR
jgi:glycerophosphoryl diester phosphodiesterase